MRTNQNAGKRRRAYNIIFLAALSGGGSLLNCNYAAGVTASWLNPVDGSWADASKWSSSLIPNNGLPNPGDHYSAIVDATGNLYSLTLNAPIAVDDFTLDSINAKVLHQSGTLSVQSTMNLQAGSYIISGGTISGATVMGAAGLQTGSIVGGVSSSTLENVTLGTSLRVNDETSALIHGNLTLQSGGIILSANSSDGAQLNFDGTAAILGSGDITTGNTANNRNRIIGRNAGTVTFGPNVSVHNNGGNIEIDFTSNLVNQGTISAATAAKSVHIFGTNFQNSGTLQVLDGTLSVTSDVWTNSGTFIVNSGSLELGGNFTGSDVANFQRNGGTVLLVGNMNLGATTLNLDATTGPVGLGISGKINGGTLTSAGTLGLAGVGTLSNVSLDMNAYVHGNLNVTSGLTLLNKEYHLVSSWTNTAPGSLQWLDTSGLNGTGTVVFDSAGTLTFLSNTVAAGITVRTGTTGGSIVENDFTNQGCISAQTLGTGIAMTGSMKNAGTLQSMNGASLTVGLNSNLATGKIIAGTNGVTTVNGTWTNAGTFVVDNGILNLGGTFNGASIGAISRNSGSINITGYCIGGLALNDTTGSWGLGSLNVGGGTIQSGVLSTSGSASLFIGGNYESFLDGVTLAGKVGGGQIGIVHGLTLATGALVTPVDLDFHGPQTLGGTGIITFDGLNPRTGVDGQISSDGTLTMGSHVTIRTGTAGGSIGAPYNGKLNNQGTLSAETSGQWLRILGPLHNTGTISLSAGTLQISESLTTGDFGNFNRTGGTFLFSGFLNNNGTTFDLANKFGTIIVGNSNYTTASPTITGGTIQASDMARLVIAQNTNSGLTGVSLIGALDDNGEISTQNGFTLNAGTITLGASSTGTLDTNGAQTVGGTGSILFGAFGGSMRPTAGQLTIGANITIASGGGDGTIGGTFGQPTLNQGRITATGANRTIVVQDTRNEGIIEAVASGKIYSNGTFTNAATLTASNNGWISLNGNWLNIGTISVADSRVDLGGSFTLATLGNFIHSGGTINLTGTLNNTSNTLALDDATGPWNMIGGTVLGGNITTSGAGILRATGAGTLDGATLSGTINVLSGGTLTFANGLTLNDGQIHLTYDVSQAKIIATGTETLSGHGSISFEGNGDHTFNVVTLTIAPDIKVVTAGAGVVFTGTKLTNQGLISSRTTEKSVQLSASTLVNQGTLEATNGGILSLGGSWSNTGTISLVDSTVNLGGTFTSGSIGTISRSGGTINIAGKLTNAGTLELNDLTGTFRIIDTGRIVGGTITTANGAQLVAAAGSGTIDGATIPGNLLITAGAKLNFANTWSVGSLSVSGGTAEFRGNGSVGSLTASHSTLNFGTITAGSGSFSVGSTQITDSLMYVGGNLDNSGRTLDLGNGTNWWTLGSNGKIIGGSITGSGGTFDTANGTLDSVSLGTTLIVDAGINSASAKIVNGLTFTNGGLITINTVSSATSSGALTATGSQTFGGTGDIVFAGGFNTAKLLSSSTLTLGSGVTVRSGDGGGTISATLVNQGLISAQTPGKFIAVSGILSNAGIIEARNSGSINFTAISSLSNYSAGILTGGNWAAYSNSTIAFGSSTISTSNASIRLDGVGSTFTAVNSLANNQGTFTVTNGRNFSTIGNLTNSGTVVVGPGSAVAVNGMLNNSGTVNVNGAMVVNYADGSPLLDTIRPQVVTGSANGAWNGAGIDSSSAAANPRMAVGFAEASTLGIGSLSGQTFDATTVLLRYTYAGDSNLDGTVDSTDFTRLASHFGSSTQLWTDGDFNYDGVVNALDFNAIATNFGQTPLSSPSLGALVPEPTLTATIALAALIPLLPRRRHRW